MVGGGGGGDGSKLSGSHSPSNLRSASFIYLKIFTNLFTGFFSCYGALFILDPLIRKAGFAPVLTIHTNFYLFYRCKPYSV